MESHSLFSCYCPCPFCLLSSLTFTFPRRQSNVNSKFSWSASLIIVLLLLSSCEAHHLRAPRQRRAEVGTSDIAAFSQKLSSQSSKQSDCSAVGKCRPCSWLDMNRKLPECLTFGFKQRSFCRDTKRESYMSCHYVPNAREVRMFWLFESAISSVGILAYALVVLRNRKIERRTARRIQEQINA